MQQDDGDGIGSPREERDEVDIESAQLVVDGDSKVGKRVDPGFCLSPGKV
jgi:hypothetical protein